MRRNSSAKLPISFIRRPSLPLMIKKADTVDKALEKCYLAHEREMKRLAKKIYSKVIARVKRRFIKMRKVVSQSCGSEARSFKIKSNDIKCTHSNFVFSLDSTLVNIIARILLFYYPNPFDPPTFRHQEAVSFVFSKGDFNVKQEIKRFEPTTNEDGSLTWHRPKLIFTIRGYRNNENASIKQMSNMHDRVVRNLKVEQIVRKLSKDKTGSSRFAQLPRKTINQIIASLPKARSMAVAKVVSRWEDHSQRIANHIVYQAAHQLQPPQSKDVGEIYISFKHKEPVINYLVRVINQQPGLHTRQLEKSFVEDMVAFLVSSIWIESIKRPESLDPKRPYACIDLESFFKHANGHLKLLFYKIKLQRRIQGRERRARNFAKKLLEPFHQRISDKIIAQHSETEIIRSHQKKKKMGDTSTANLVEAVPKSKDDTKLLAILKTLILHHYSDPDERLPSVKKFIKLIFDHGKFSFQCRTKKHTSHGRRVINIQYIITDYIDKNDRNIEALDLLRQNEHLPVLIQKKCWLQFCEEGGPRTHFRQLPQEIMVMILEKLDTATPTRAAENVSRWEDNSRRIADHMLYQAVSSRSKEPTTIDITLRKKDKAAAHRFITMILNHRDDPYSKEQESHFISTLTMPLAKSLCIKKRKDDEGGTYRYARSELTKFFNEVHEFLGEHGIEVNYPGEISSKDACLL